MTPRWLLRLSPFGDRRVLCIPPAGGAPDAYREWVGKLGPGVEVWTVVLPGRDRRMAEPLERDLGKIVNALITEWLELPPLPFVVFGHSLGAIIAYQMSRGLIHRGATLPNQLCVAGSRAPHIPTRQPLHALPPEEFILQLRKLGGISEELAASPGLLELFEPIIRADVALAELHEFHEGRPLPFPIVAFAGTRDPLGAIADMEQWGAHSSVGFELVVIDGDHFFPRQPDFPAALSNRLSRAGANPNTPGS